MEGNNLLVISLTLEVDIGQPREIPRNFELTLKILRVGTAAEDTWLVCNAQISKKSCHS